MLIKLNLLNVTKLLELISHSFLYSTVSRVTRFMSVDVMKLNSFIDISRFMSVDVMKLNSFIDISQENVIMCNDFSKKTYLCRFHFTGYL